jgi:coenzyme F420-0:L-glutamate ligase / coenzyme F420-1:gamma-L-glutamate ligase
MPVMAAEIRILGVDGIPEASAGDDPAQLVLDGLKHSGIEVADGDVLVVTHKLVSKAEDRLIDLRGVTPSVFAERLAKRYEKDPRQVEIVLQESTRIVKMDRGVIIAETPHGFICANAGVDASNAPESSYVVLLPVDPDHTARKIREAVQTATGTRIAVIITDSFGRPWRAGIINIAIGVAGMSPFTDYRGEYDEHGYELRATVIAAADEIASAAELVMGKLDRRPVAIVRGYDYLHSDEATGRELVMDPAKDLFR